MSGFRVGFGYDVHRFVDRRKLILGGVEITSDFGLDGHSDADALLHAITDAILGAAALGDIGKHFPDTDPKYKGADSKILLSDAYQIVREKGYAIVNVDSTVVLQRPKLAPYIDEMRQSVADILKTSKENISVKATTEEGLGFVGDEKGIKVYAVAMLRKNEN